MTKSTIHPTSAVSETAEIGEGSVIGPFCSIGENVKLGPRSKLFSHVVIDGNTTIGEDCEIFPFACIGMKTQDLKYKGEKSYVEIGDRNVLREYVTVNSATEKNGKTSIGDDCLIQSYCHIAHECILKNKVIMSSGAMLSGHVEIDDYAIIGGYVGVVQFVKVGTMAMVGGYSKLSQDVLPYSIAEGVPAETRSINKVGMDRNGKTQQQIRTVSEAFKRIIRPTNGLQQVAEELGTSFPDSQEIKTILDFISRSERGLARPKFLKNKRIQMGS